MRKLLSFLLGSSILVASFSIKAEGQLNEEITKFVGCYAKLNTWQNSFGLKEGEVEYTSFPWIQITNQNEEVLLWANTHPNSRAGAWSKNAVFHSSLQELDKSVPNLDFAKSKKRLLTKENPGGVSNFIFSKTDDGDKFNELKIDSQYFMVSLNGRVFHRMKKIDCGESLKRQMESERIRIERLNSVRSKPIPDTTNAKVGDKFSTDFELVDEPPQKQHDGNDCKLLSQPQSRIDAKLVSIENNLASVDAKIVVRAEFEREQSRVDSYYWYVVVLPDSTQRFWCTLDEGNTSMVSGRHIYEQVCDVKIRGLASLSEISRYDIFVNSFTCY